MESKQCMARTWNKGYGARCKNKVKSGDFCDIHNKRSKSLICKEKKCKNFGKEHFFTWEHLGRWDDLPPSFFVNPSCWSMDIDNFKEKPFKIEHRIVNNSKTNKLKLVTIEYYSNEKRILSPLSQKILTTIPK